MKKVLVLLILTGLFIFGSVSVQAALDKCNLSKHSVRRDSTYTYVDGNIWYYSKSGANMFYELDYLDSYYEIPVTVDWGDEGLHIQFRKGYTIIGNLSCWQEKILGSYNRKGDLCLWSDTKAERTSNTGVVGLYGGETTVSVKIKSAKSI